MNIQKYLIFDLDGTLYPFDSNGVQGSILYNTIIRNTAEFLLEHTNVTGKEVKEVIEGILKEYGEDFSIAVEKKYGINRYEYFKKVWDINPKSIIPQETKIRFALTELQLLEGQHFGAIPDDPPRQDPLDLVV